MTREDDDGGAKRRVQVEGSPGSSTVRVFWEQRHGDYKAGTDYWETFRDPQCLKIMGEQHLHGSHMQKEWNFLREACLA